ncbi:MAG TPA: formate dehydrogenase, partial [Burkholderiales bacterium]|nr:formate dehydrogenase [Burkholderiales bacterium]
MSAITVYVPCDSAAISVGADDVAIRIILEATAQGKGIVMKRNGSRGMLWLEPMVEVQVGKQRIAYGPVTPDDVPSLFAANFLQGGEHVLRVGAPEEHPYLKNQERLTFERVGITEPTSIDDYLEHHGYRGLHNAIKMATTEVVKAVTDSGLRGRGGAAFPTGIKWKTVHDQVADQKYVVCNADEGDSGTFSDRMIMEDDPYVLIEGMTIAGIACGATHGYIYLRSEYPYAHVALNRAIEVARQRGYLGLNVMGSGKAFELEVRMGAGAYICGEETALLESIEGKRGMVR